MYTSFFSLFFSCSKPPVTICILQSGPDTAAQCIYIRRNSARNHYEVDDTSVVQCLWLLEMRGSTSCIGGSNPPMAEVKILDQ
jgi:hypothetical protein